jgi:hypothetical protein
MYLLVHTGPEMDESCIVAQFIDPAVLRIVNTSIDID